MNRAERRNQFRPKSSARKTSLTFLTVAGVVSGTVGLASPAQADAYTSTDCTQLASDLTALQVSGGTLTADFAGNCDFAEGYVFQLATTITGPTNGSLKLQFADGVSFGFVGQSDLTISNLNFAGRPSQVNQITFVLSYSQPLIVLNTTFSNAETELTAAIGAEGDLTVENSTFMNLSSLNGGPAIYTNVNAPATITNSTFIGNKALGQSSGGAIVSNSNLEITNSTFDSNEAGDSGGAIAAYYSGFKEIKNSTFVGNSALSGAAIYLSEGGVIANSTFWNNGDTDTFSFSMNGLGPFTAGAYFFANILANDTPNTVELFDPVEKVTDLGANLYTDASFNDTTSLEGESKLVTTEALQLSLLSLNQTNPANTGRTETVEIGTGSVAQGFYTAASPGINPVGHLNAFLSTTLLPTVDQRGVSRPQGAGYDVGAFELGESPTEETEKETLADTGLPTDAGYLGLVGLGAASILGGSVGLLRRRKKA